MALGDILIPIFERAWGDSLSGLVSSSARGASALEDGQGAASGAPAPLAPPSSLAEARDEAEAITDQLVRWLWSRNQFEPLDEQAREQLFASVEGALAAMERSGQLEPALSEHRRELSDFVHARLGKEPREVVRRVLAGLAARGARPGTDVPLSGALARHRLRARRAAGARSFLEGIAAEGVDRDATLDVATRDDWLTHDYERKRWGSVLSHQGFTLHFLHHHHARGDTAYAYARVYMSILRALKMGGRFAYAPGLPFIEGLLDAASYRVQRIPFADALRVPSLVAIETDTGLELSYATHVTRV